MGKADKSVPSTATGRVQTGRTPAASPEMQSTLARSSQLARARDELRRIKLEIEVADRQRAAVREKRLKYFQWTETSEELLLRRKVELLRLRQRNVRKWLARQEQKAAAARSSAMAESAGGSEGAGGREKSPEGQKNKSGKRKGKKGSRKLKVGGGSVSAKDRIPRGSVARGVSRGAGIRRARLIG